MREWKLAIWIAALLFFIAFGGCMEVIQPVQSKTIYVDDDGGVDYTKIQEGEDYNLLIMTPGDFSDELQPLVGHKKQYGIVTKIVTLDDVYESVYFPVNGRDDAEKIKYFIKSAKENWNTNYVMLVGGKEDMPVRFVENIFGRHYNLFISDLYFADIYNKNGSFCSWDSNQNNVFGIVKQAKAKKGHFYAVFILQNNLNLLGLSKKYCFEKLPAENIYNIL